jgi:cytochrome c
VKRFVTIAAAVSFIFGAALLAVVRPIQAQSSGSNTGSGMMMQSGGQNSQNMMMMGPGIFMPSMDPVNGRKLFASKGCVICHAVNGVGGKDAAPFDASTMPRVMNPFDFVANMWQGAQMMITMQQQELKQQTSFTGQELADIIAFLHDPNEERKFSAADIPPEIKAHMEQ